MRKHTINLYTSVALLVVAIASLVLLGMQQVQAAFKKAAAEGESLRITEVNACSADESAGDDVHFTGCNSII